MNLHNTIDVLVVGAGPAGTALAIDLARRGLDFRIIDKAAHSFSGSRAKGIQPRTLEVLHDLDVLPDIMAAGNPYPLLGIHAGPLTVPWRMMANDQATSAVPYPNTWLIPQYATDAALHAQLNRLGHEVEFGTELTDFTQDGTQVTATLETADGSEQVTARYLVGADGGGSTVRRQLGVGFEGTTDEQDRMVIVDASVSGLSSDRWHVWPALGGKFMGACPLPEADLFQWMIRLKNGEEPPLDEKSLNARIHSHTRNSRIRLHSIRWTSVFRPNIRLAEHYRVGRVFLAGDAAHVHTPAGAQGLNTGVQDAYNLGWKLAQVIAGADDALLDTYEAERLPIAASVLGLSTAKYQGIAKLDPSSIRRGSDEKQLAITYFGGPLANSGGSTKTLRVGDRAPDAELIGTGGRKVRLFDLYRGPQFVALACGDKAARVLDCLEWPDGGSPLHRTYIDSVTDRNLVDWSHDFRQSYGITEPTIVIVRPDGYLGHIATGDALSAESISRALTVFVPATASTSTESDGGR
ncbi:FAD-dependent oxidoreductase [Antrihabitans stalactiti]|uniref:FAD-binding protein n=1 Tax=Antrihabitans stalactiti TaxID=2584121 RepID=A0A848KBI5_9NOCA|nr:FAD-dependent oxidoreductase [Antrihabitans stalactiti]NMN95671.1 FAD-binding protein [Antrihabitans stalactiti]